MNIKNYFKKGFTLIELVISMSIIGILALLASPKFLNYINKSKMTQIFNDSKVAEDYTIIYESMNKKLPQGKKVDEDDINNLKNNNIFFNNKKIDNLDQFEKSELFLLNKENLKNNINTKLKGTFIYTNEGVIYIDKEYAFEDDINIPKPVKKEVKFITGDIVDSHTLIVTEKGELYSWGNQILNGFEEYRDLPSKFPYLNDKKVKKVRITHENNLFITEDGKAYISGLNKNSQLLLPTDGGKLGYTAEPLEINKFKNEVKQPFIIDGVIDPHRGLLLSDEGYIYTWDQSKPELEKIDNLSNIIKIELSNDYSNFTAGALDKDGNLYSWGDNAHGELGHGDIKNVSTPKQISTINNIVDFTILKSGNKMAAINDKGIVYNWGSEISRTPLETNIIDAEKLFSNTHQLYALLNNGELISFGKNINKTNYLNIKYITGEGHVDGGVHLYINNKNEVYTWGYNDNGQLGHGDKEFHTKPKQINIFEYVYE